MGRQLIKYFFALVFALGVLLHPFYKPTIVYECTGTEMFPTYYGCPFIYKATNLGTSLAWDFFFWPTLANLVVWMAFFLLLRQIVYRTLLKYESKTVKYCYLGVKFALAIYFLFWIVVSFNYEGYALESSVDFESEAKAWGMTCEGHISFKEYRSPD